MNKRLALSVFLFAVLLVVPAGTIFSRPQEKAASAPAVKTVPERANT